PARHNSAPLGPRPRTPDLPPRRAGLPAHGRARHRRPRNPGVIQFGQDSGVTTKHARYTKVIERNFVYFVVVTYLGIRLFLPLDFLSDCFERTRNCKRLIVSVVATAAIGSGAALACLWRPD